MGSNLRKYSNYVKNRGHITEWRVIRNGAREARPDAHLSVVSYPHDIIDFSQSPANTNFDEFQKLYTKGHSLQAISDQLKIPKSTLRDFLVSKGMELRANNKINPETKKKSIREFYGAVPYGFQLLDGKLVMDPKETKIVRKILSLWRDKKSFNAIAKWLNGQGIPSKLNKKWSDKTVASVIRRNAIKNENGEKNE